MNIFKEHLLTEFWSEQIEFEKGLFKPIFVLDLLKEQLESDFFKENGTVHILGMFDRKFRDGRTGNFANLILEWFSEVDYWILFALVVHSLTVQKFDKESPVGGNMNFGKVIMKIVFTEED